jgi:hypothetical protein
MLDNLIRPYRNHRMVTVTRIRVKEGFAEQFGTPRARKVRALAVVGNINTGGDYVHRRGTGAGVRHFPVIRKVFGSDGKAERVFV